MFLSYASEDVEAAQRICEGLRAVGIEVWFDKSELRGGDAWDRSIRQQIHDCRLFIAVISAHTEARDEGYFRREWRLAVERAGDMAEDKPFVVPVAIDGTSERSARVPDPFKHVQWTRLPSGETPPAFVKRILRLLSPEPARAAPEVRLPAAAAPHVAHAPRQPLPVLLVMAAATAMVVGYFAVDRFVLSKRGAARTETSTGQASASASSVIPEKSVAVLPFADMSEKKDQEYFSDGLTEELIDLLSQVQDLRVPARTSSFFFKGKQVTIAEIAKALGVTHVLEGSVRKSGDALRITVQLIRADNGYHLWSKTYDGNTKDVFKVQDAVAAAVVEVLKAKLARAQLLASSRTANPEAYDQYLLGRQFWNFGNPDDIRRSLEAYQKAIALDPNYAAAYAGLAFAEGSVASRTGDAEGFKRAEATAEKAIALAPGEADGYSARGFLRGTGSWDWAGAQEDFSKALALNPADGRVQNRYARLLESLGRLPEAIAADRKAIDLDPLVSPSWNRLGILLIESRDYPAAREALRRALEIQPDSTSAANTLGTLQLLEGRAAEALVTFRKNSYSAFRLTGVAMAEHTLGHAKESQQALDELIAKETTNAAYQIAEAFAWRGEKDRAFEWLEHAYARRDASLSRIKVDPLLASVRGDPRYTALLRKMNLPV